jgi:hypothetical protein
MVRIPLTWYPEPGTRHLCTILTFQILTEHYLIPPSFDFIDFRFENVLEFSLESE